jgi:hypothetical protein
VSKILLIVFFNLAFVACGDLAGVCYIKDGFGFVKNNSKLSLTGKALSMCIEAKEGETIYKQGCDDLKGELMDSCPSENKKFTCESKQIKKGKIILYEGWKGCGDL